MAKVKGTVTGVGKGKYSHFVLIDTKDGYYFNTKFEPKCGEGDVVGIEYDDKGERGNITKLKVLEKNSSGYQPSNSGGGSQGGSRQDSIVWQSSRKDALVLIGMLLDAAAIKLPSKSDAKRVVIEELVDEATATYFNAATDPRNCKAFTSNTEVEEDAKEEEDEPEDEWGGDEPKGEWED